MAVVVQARMSSYRLPGKVLAEIAGRPALELLLHRLGGAEEVAVIAVATSERPDDDPIAEAVGRTGAECIRGSLEDVLGRYALAAETLEADAVVRVTGDCPLLDPAVIDLIVRSWRQGEADYVSNLTDPPTYPIGQHGEVLSRSALDTAHREATEADDREHVTLYVKRHPERFPAVFIEGRPEWGALRMVLDTAEDLAVLQELGRRCGPDATLKELVAGLDPGSA